MDRGVVMCLLFFLPLATAQAANATDCSWSFAEQMGSGGGSREERASSASSCTQHFLRSLVVAVAIRAASRKSLTPTPRK